jgi:hypothetical protein
MKTVLWECSKPTINEISAEWKRQTGNNYLSQVRLSRATLGKSKNELIKMYRIGQLGKARVKLVNLEGLEPDDIIVSEDSE